MTSPEPYRVERAYLGSKPVPQTALHGIHTQRVLENFPLSRQPIFKALIHVYGAVKLATATVTALIDVIGYKIAEDVLSESEHTQESLREIVVQKGLLTEAAFDELMGAEAVICLGSRKETD